MGHKGTVFHGFRKNCAQRPMTTATAPHEAYASQISMGLPPSRYSRTLVEPAKAYGKTKCLHNANAYLPFDEGIGRLSNLQPELHRGKLHIFHCCRLQGRVPCFDFALNGAVVLFMGRVESAFVHVFPPIWLLPFAVLKADCPWSGRQKSRKPKPMARRTASVPKPTKAIPNSHLRMVQHVCL